MAGLFVLSLVVLVFMRGSAPFGLSVASVQEEHRLALLHTHTGAAEALVGERVARTAGLHSVLVYEVEEAVRVSGRSAYSATLAGTDVAAQLTVQESGRQVLLSIPLLGYWVKALAHPVGLMALLGAPLAMLVLDVLLALGATQLVARVRELTHRTDVDSPELVEQRSVEVYEYEEDEMVPERVGVFARMRAALRRHTETAQEVLDTQDGFSVALPRRTHHYGV